ncbi:hypothetical protein [Enterococcus sp.]
MESQVIIIQDNRKIDVPLPSFGEIILKIQDGKIVIKHITTTERLK